MDIRNTLTITFIYFALMGLILVGCASVHEKGLMHSKNETRNNSKSERSFAELIPAPEIKKLSMESANPFILFKHSKCHEKCQSEYENCRREVLGSQERGSGISVVKNCQGIYRGCLIKCNKEEENKKINPNP